MFLLLLKRRYLLLFLSLAWFVAKRVLRRKLAARASQPTPPARQSVLDRVLGEIERFLRGL